MAHSESSSSNPFAEGEVHPMKSLLASTSLSNNLLSSSAAGEQERRPCVSSWIASSGLWSTSDTTLIFPVEASYRCPLFPVESMRIVAARSSKPHLSSSSLSASLISFLFTVELIFGDAALLSHEPWRDLIRSSLYNSITASSDIPRLLASARILPKLGVLLDEFTALWMRANIA